MLISTVESCSALTAHGLLELKQEIQIQTVEVVNNNYFILKSFRVFKSLQRQMFYSLGLGLPFRFCGIARLILIPTVEVVRNILF
jgi:hypothetical protein